MKQVKIKRNTDLQTDSHTDRQTDRQTKRQTDRQTEAERLILIKSNFLSIMF